MTAAITLVQTGAAMTAATWITLGVIGTIVWGGFALALVTAVRRESGRGKKL